MKPAYILSACLCIILPQLTQAQTNAADNKISESVTFSEPPQGKSVYGIFEGRTPCKEISRRFSVNMPADCERIKWQLILFRDSVTLRPTTYTLFSSMFDYQPQTGSWEIKRGTTSNPVVEVIVIHYGQAGKSLSLLKGDENVLFILDEQQQFQAGDRNFSYTLNRVQKVLRPKP